jgi:protein-tyrosine kinase
MSTRASFFHSAFAPAGFSARVKAVSPVQHIAEPPVWDAGRFAEDQIRRLVRQVFFPGWPRPAHHVAFAAVDERTDAEPICIEVGEILCAQAPGNVCVVEAVPRASPSDFPEDCAPMRTPGKDVYDPARFRTRRLSSRLWHVPYEVFSAQDEQHPGSSEFDNRIRRLRAEFDYTAIHVPPAGTSNDAILLGQLCDGVVLILEANLTRRAAAQKVKEMLQAANVRLLGAVLNGRTFPIPHAIYHKL